MSGVYDSDRASNGTSTSCSCFLSVLYMCDTRLSAAEDSGNSSEQSDPEDPPDKKPSPWRAPPHQEEERAKEEAEPSDIITVSLTAKDGTLDTATAGQPPTALPCPSMPQERSDMLLNQSEKEETEQGAEPAGGAAELPTHLGEKKRCALQEAVPGLSPAQEAPLMKSPGRTSPSGTPLLPPCSPQRTPIEEDSGVGPLSRVKVRKANLRESGSESPPRIPLCTPAAASSPPHVASPPRGILKRQDEPMVVLHCLSTQHLHPEGVTGDSDTDSATEEEEATEEAGSEERSSSALKRKAAEQRTAEKKLRPDSGQEETTPPKTPPVLSKMTSVASPKGLPSPFHRGESDRRSEGMMKAQVWPRPVEETLEERLAGGAAKEPEVHDGTRPTAAELSGPAAVEELEPQIGPEALVCHEVDLDDLDDKEKASPEHLLLMMREQQQTPPQLPNLHPPPHIPQPQVRPFLPAADSNCAPCSEELHPAGLAAEQERGAMRGEHEGDSSTSSSASLQENRDRGKPCLAAAGRSL